MSASGGNLVLGDIVLNDQTAALGYSCAAVMLRPHPAWLDVILLTCIMYGTL